MQALREARASGDTLVVPASAYAEALVGPSRRGDEAVATAALRARHGRALRLPDALVLATATLRAVARMDSLGVRLIIRKRSDC